MAPISKAASLAPTSSAKRGGSVSSHLAHASSPSKWPPTPSRFPGGAEAWGHVSALRYEERRHTGEKPTEEVEALAKAHVFLRDFGAAKAELTRAHEIAAARYGKDDRRTKRIAEVLESVQQHVVAAPAAA